MADAAAVTVPEAARLLARNPETIRRWIREGKVRASKVGTQHLIAASEIELLRDSDDAQLPLPREWQRTASGAPMPDLSSAVRRSRAGH